MKEMLICFLSFLIGKLSKEEEAMGSTVTIWTPGRRSTYITEKAN
jgi:hypothetical protein